MSRRTRELAQARMAGFEVVNAAVRANVPKEAAVAKLLDGRALAYVAPDYDGVNIGGVGSVVARRLILLPPTIDALVTLPVGSRRIVRFVHKHTGLPVSATVDDQRMCLFDDDLRVTVGEGEPELRLRKADGGWVFVEDEPSGEAVLAKPPEPVVPSEA